MRYFWETVKHKWFVFLASRRTGLSLWRAIVHDWSKFSKYELWPYNEQLYGDACDPAAFVAAWLHHQNHNDHHPEYWQIRSEHVLHGTPVSVKGCLPMSGESVVEMVTDWLGKERAYTGSWDIMPWLRENLNKKRLHPDTKQAVDDFLYGLGYDL